MSIDIVNSGNHPPKVIVTREFQVDGRQFIVQKGRVFDPLGDRLREGMIGCRESFVTAMGWHPIEKEGQDIADINEDTIHFGRFVGERAATTMRLTPFDISRVRDESLSIGEMLSSKPDMQEDAVKSLSESVSIFRDSSSIECYDLTRLTVDLSGELHHNADSIKQDTATMIGIGIHQTNALRDANEGVVAWTFCLHPAMKGVLDEMGIQSQVLASGEITPGDGYESVVCVAYPKSAYEFVVNDHERFGSGSRYSSTYECVTHGINSSMPL